MNKTHILSLFLIKSCYLALSVPYIYGMAPAIADHTSPNAVQSANKVVTSVDRYIAQLIQQGDAYYDERQYLVGALFYKEALQQYEANYTEKNLLLALISHKLGIGYLSFNAYAQSFLYLQQALGIRQRCLSTAITSGHELLKKSIRKAIGQSHYHIGRLHLAMNNFQAAAQSFQAAFEIKSSSTTSPNEEQLKELLTSSHQRNSVAHPSNAIITLPTVQPSSLIARKEERAGYHQVSQSLDKTILAKQAKVSYVALKKEKSLSQVTSKRVDIGQAQGALPSLIMTTFPNIVFSLSDVLSTSNPSHVTQDLRSGVSYQQDPQRQYPQRALPQDEYMSNPLACKECGKKCLNNAKLIIHMRAHTGGKPFACSICDKKFPRKQSMKVHLRVHTGEKPFACSICDKKFSQKQNMKQHMRAHTGGKPFACSICDKKFSQKQHMKQHMRVHTGEKPFACAFCDKKFSEKQKMKQHMRVHTGEKPFACPLCSKKFSRKQSVKIHIVVHTDEKPYACPYCNKKFALKQYLKVHLRVHTGEKPFACPVCDKKFSQKQHVTDHLRVHTGEKPFACPVCERKFSNKGYVKTHLRVHTGEKPFVCTICEKKFSRKQHMKEHIKCVHNN